MINHWSFIYEWSLIFLSNKMKKNNFLLSFWLHYNYNLLPLKKKRFMYLHIMALVPPTPYQLDGKNARGTNLENWRWRFSESLNFFSNFWILRMNYFKLETKYNGAQIKLIKINLIIYDFQPIKLSMSGKPALLIICVAKDRRQNYASQKKNWKINHGKIKRSIILGVVLQKLSHFKCMKF